MCSVCALWRSNGLPLHGYCFEPQLAARIAVSNLHKNTEKSFSKT